MPRHYREKCSLKRWMREPSYRLLYHERIPSSGVARTNHRLYTDLLLHNMGPGLRTLDPTAHSMDATSWSIGLTSSVSGGEAYLHDGRARTLEEAILWHGGEGTRSRAHSMHLQKKSEPSHYFFEEFVGSTSFDARSRPDINLNTRTKRTEGRRHQTEDVSTSRDVIDCAHLTIQQPRQW